MAEPEGLRTRLNDDRRRRFGHEARLLALVCECDDPDCRRTVLLSREEYDALRPSRVIHPEHRDMSPPVN
jgi:hypothetical protein